MTQWPAAAPWRKSQLPMRNGKGTVTYGRLVRLIVEVYADAFSRSDPLRIVRDGSLHVSIAIDVGDYRGRRRQQDTSVELVS